MAATLTLRSVKGAPLTNNEVDSNFTNLNTEISTIEGNISTINSNISTLQSAVGPNLPETVADIVGGMVTSNTESGISVTYQDGDNTLDFDVSDFTITVNGDASGSGTITNLGNTTITLDVSNISGNLTVSGDLTNNGSFTSTSGTFSGDVNAANFNSTSDISMKENLSIIESPLEKISQLNGYTFNWKSSQKEAIGVVAQEVEKVFPQMVMTGEDGVKRVSYDSLIPALLEAIKELNTKIK
jgi:hypothetical protein